jgi:O-antigen ligase
MTVGAVVRQVTAVTHSELQSKATLALAIAYLALVAVAWDLGLHVWLVAAAVAAVVWPRAGIILMAVTLIPPEVEIATALPTGFILAAAAASGRLVGITLAGRPFRLGWPVAALAIFTLVTVISVAGVVSRSTPFPEAMREWTILTAGILACLVVASDRETARRAPAIVFTLGVVVSVVAALAVLLPGPFQAPPLGWLIQQGAVGRALGATHGANVLGAVAAMSFAYFSIRAVAATRPLERARDIGLALACLPALYFTFSRSATLGVGVAIVLGLVMLARRSAVLVTVVLVAGAVLLGPTLFANRLDTSSGSAGGHVDPRVTDAQATSDQLRIEAWVAGLRMAVARPITGVGFGRYVQVRKQYGAPMQLTKPHSDYIRFFAETGVPGGVAFLAFLGGVAWSIRRARGAERASIAAALVAFGVATQFNAQLYYLDAGLAFWVAAGAALYLGASAAPTDGSSGRTPVIDDDPFAPDARMWRDSSPRGPHGYSPRVPRRREGWSTEAVRHARSPAPSLLG